MADSSPFDTLHSSTLFYGWILLAIPTVGGAVILLRSDEETAKLAAMFAAYATLCLWTVFLASKHCVHWRSLLGLDRGFRDWRLIGLVIPLVAASIAGIYLIYYPLSFMNPELATSIMNSETASFVPGKWARTLSTLFMGVILAPVVEEVMFRGFLLHRWARKWGVRRALFWTSLLFGILHVDVIGGLVFGFVLGLVYLRTRTLLIPIVIHIFNNALGSLAEMMDPTGGETFDLVEFQSTWYVGALALVVAVAGLWFARRHYRPEPGWHLPYDSSRRMVEAGPSHVSIE